MTTVFAQDENAAFIRKDGVNFEELPTADGAQGVWFTCPIESCGHLQIVWFENPLNAERVLDDKPFPRWHRTGETLDTLSLSPSIHDTTPGGCGWHGWVRNGEAK